MIKIAKILFILFFASEGARADRRDLRQFENEIEEQSVKTESDYFVPIDIYLGEYRSGFGVRRSMGGQRKNHLGIDIAAYPGTLVKAAKEGVIVRLVKGCYPAPIGEGFESEAANCGEGFGNHVIIRHPDGNETLYAHMQNSCRVKVALGQEIEARQPIGCVGNSGRSQGPHLHFEIHEDGKAVDPTFYLRNQLRQYRRT